MDTSSLLLHTKSYYRSKVLQDKRMTHNLWFIDKRIIPCATALISLSPSLALAEHYQVLFRFLNSLFLWLSTDRTYGSSLSAVGTYR